MTEIRHPKADIRNPMTESRNPKFQRIELHIYEVLFSLHILNHYACC